MVLLFIILISIFPKYINFVQLLIEDIQNSLNPQAKEPEADYRVTGGGDLIIVKDIIANHPLFGIGYYPVQWSQIVDMKNSGQLWALALDASSEVPIYGSTMRLGIIGLVIPAIIHVKILFTSIKSLIKTKANIVSEIKRPSELLLYLTLILHVFSIYSIDLPSLFSEYYSGYSFIYFSSCVGILLGLKTRMDAREINSNNKNENSDLASSQT
jgi:O-antigen ligase